jgi:phosphoribosyl 1,2-cyclic phosphate phosphodiesterase
LRTSAVIEAADGKRILIDATPDLRAQLLRNRIAALDGVVITHDHADHTHGVDDLRPFGFGSGGPLPVFATADTARGLALRFPYIFDRDRHFAGRAVLGGGIPLLHTVAVGPGPATIAGNDVELFLLPHGHTETLGLRHRRMAYLTDCREVPDAAVARLRDARLELLIIDCLRPQPHQTHLHLDLTLEYVSRIGPRLAVLTHMGHEWDFLELTAELLRRGVKNTLPARDGQQFLYS